MSHRLTIFCLKLYLLVQVLVLCSGEKNYYDYCPDEDDLVDLLSDDDDEITCHKIAKVFGDDVPTYILEVTFGNHTVVPGSKVPLELANRRPKVTWRKDAYKLESHKREGSALALIDLDASDTNDDDDKIGKTAEYLQWFQDNISSESSSAGTARLPYKTPLFRFQHSKKGNHLYMLVLYDVDRYVMGRLDCIKRLCREARLITPIDDLRPYIEHCGYTPIAINFFYVWPKASPPSRNL